MQQSSVMEDDAQRAPKSRRNLRLDLHLGTTQKGSQMAQGDSRDADEQQSDVEIGERANLQDDEDDGDNAGESAADAEEDKHSVLMTENEINSP